MSSRLRAWIGKRLRYAADRIDDEHAIVCFGGYWNHRPTGIEVTVTHGVQAQPPVPGVPLLFQRSDYERAFIGLLPGDYGYENGWNAAVRLGLATTT